MTGSSLPNYKEDMTLDEVHDAWGVDSKIDPSDLGSESLKTPRLHHKWLRMLSYERLTLKRMEAALKHLRHRKTQFYAYGPDEDSNAEGWTLPPRGKILRTEASTFVESDKDVLALADRVAHQVEVVDAIEQVIKTINNRGFAIKNSLEWLRFTNGG